MYYNRHTEEFPFNGVFYTVPTVKPENGDLLGDGNLLEESGVVTPQETVLLETVCDIQQAAKLINSGTIMADFKVFIPCEVGARLPIRFNTNFRCEDYAIPVNGRVVGLEYSQLGGCSIDIKMSEV